MLKRLQLKSFRGFEKLDANLSPISVLVGANSAGKTTVLHAIRLACESLADVARDPEAAPDINESGRITACHRWVVQEPEALVSLSDWTETFLGGRVKDGASLNIGLTFAPEDSVQNVSLELAYGRNRQLLRSIYVKSEAAAKGIKRRARGWREQLREQLQRVSPIAVFVPAFYGVTRTEEYRTQPLVSRLLGSGDQSHIVRNLVARLDAGALERLNGLLSTALRTRISRRTTQADADMHADLSVYFRDNNGELELSSAGTGVVSLIALFAAMERLRTERTTSPNRPVMFLVDEPEAHLHPRLQAEAAEAMAQLAVREFGVQLLVATHSVEVINRLGRREDAVLLQVDRRAPEPVVELRTESETIEALETFCDLTPFTSLSFLASRRVLFYEGVSDGQILEACARVAFRSDPERLRRWRSYTVIPLHGSGNVSVQGVLKLVLSPRLFPKLDAKNAVRAALVLDRDYSREPRAPALTQVAPHLEAIQLTWSRHSIENLFLDADVLSAWLEPSLGVDAATLRTLLSKALAEADKDQALDDEARDGRYAYHRRPDDKHKMLDEREASKKTREEVRSAPHVFQRGHSRASFVLGRLRETLPSAARSKLRGKLADIVAAAPPDSIRDPGTAIPKEVQALLDLMVS